MQPDVLRIAAIGPESTGKTTLCRQLASCFQTVWVPEFARTYLPTLERPYEKADVLYCAAMQIRKEDEALGQANRFLFSDTELINIKCWLLDKYGECPEWVEKKIAERRYDFYLLTAPDIPFIPDPLRENPDRREYFFQKYKAELEARSFPFLLVSGDENKRLTECISVISALPQLSGSA
jgi:NadR type nicotinamide-nucleotide adenylyltransferase